MSQFEMFCIAIEPESRSNPTSSSSLSHAVAEAPGWTAPGSRLELEEHEDSTGVPRVALHDCVVALTWALMFNGVAVQVRQ